MKTFPRTEYQKRNQESRASRLERQLRTIRNNIFDLPEKKGEKAMRIIEKIKTELEPVWHQRGVDFRSESMLRLWA